MIEIHTWWDDAVAIATTLARETQLRHRVTAVRDMVDGRYIVVGWRVDLADGEHRLGFAKDWIDRWVTAGPKEAVR